MSHTNIQYWNRRKARLETEKVYGDAFVRFAYENPLGKFLEKTILSSSWFSQLYGATQNSEFSAKKIPGFVKNFSIPMADYENKDFQNFNDFFIRKFAPGKRPFVEDSSVLAAPAEARYFAYASLNQEEKIPVKGQFLQAGAVLEGLQESAKFENGPCLLARLCPVDYHRFHFPCDGKVLDFMPKVGRLHSVNPIALKADPKIFIKNERHITILESEHFGLLAYVEVGATCVGKIVQSHPLEKGQTFTRGDEKGYFLFGGSTVIVYGEKGAWLPDSDLLEKTRAGIECLVELGSSIAKATK